MSEVTGPSTYVASAVALVAGLTLNEWVAVVSLVVMIATFFLNWWFKYHQFILTMKSVVQYKPEGEKQTRQGND